MTENEPDDLAKAIQCVLFTSSDTLSSARLAEILEVEKKAIEKGVERLQETLADGGLQVVELAGGYQLATRPEYGRVVHRLLQPTPAKLSPQALEVLAIIAYRQPLTRPEVDSVRGVNSQHAVATLVEKGVITTVGRKEAPGRPLLYGTTPHFLLTFGLKDLEQLPNLEALRHAVVEQAPTVLRGVSQTGDDEALALQVAESEAAGSAVPEPTDPQTEAEEQAGLEADPPTSIDQP